LLDVLGHDQATVVGHSLGGGIALSFAYNYPARVRRIALISTGGLGREVHPLLRALSLSGASPALRLLTMRPTLGLLRVLARLARKVRARTVARSIWALQLMLANAGGRERRTALLTTVRAVIGHRGQRACVLDRLHLLRRIPTLVLWGTRDRVIPAHHASAALASNPGAEVALLDGTGHLPHLTRAGLVAERLISFINDVPIPTPVVAENRVTGSTCAPRPATSPAWAAEAPI
jgi:pimeloyl-ACP methyl ester carboxylesterase